MAQTSFPNSVWDGTTHSRQSFSVSRGPDGVDWDRCVEEVRAVQSYLLGGGLAKTEVRNVSVNTVLVNSNGTLLVLVNANAGEIQITLPEGNSYPVKIKKIDSTGNHVVVIGATTIDDEAEIRITEQWSAPEFITAEGDWYLT